MEEQPISRASAAHAARLNRTLKELQDRVKEQEAALEKLRATSKPIPTEPSSDAVAQLQQLRYLKSAYETVTPEAPYLPPPDSPLPALLALRSTHITINETKECLITAQEDLGKTQQRLEQEKKHLSDAHLMARSLEARIESLHAQKEERTQKSPSNIAKDMIRELKRKKARYESETQKLVKAFNSFLDDHLASMLAVEELGGPVVGDMLDVDELSLESGFTTQGKTKKYKNAPDDDKRQQRIDQIWGQRPDEGGRRKEPWDEKRAAAAEMRELTEELLNSLVEAEGGASDGYVELQRESAAARFLVRSKVAQFHPRDARRLRLIDFGRDLDD